MAFFNEGFQGFCWIRSLQHQHKKVTVFSIVIKTDNIGVGGYSFHDSNFPWSKIRSILHLYLQRSTKANEKNNEGFQDKEIWIADATPTTTSRAVEQSLDAGIRN